MSILILTMALIVFALTCCRKRCMSAKNQERASALKNKIFFNPIIRYTLLNTLKFNLAAMTAIIGG